jgi:ribosomal protein S18 acetylase RimI-like enzyme
MEQGRVIKIYKRPGTGIIIRNPRKDDYEDIMQLLRSRYEELVALGRRKDARVKKPVQKWWAKAVAGEKKNETILVAEIDGKVWGFVNIGKEKSKSCVAEVGFILVNKDYRHFTIGKKLLKSAIREAKKEIKPQLIILHTDSDNRFAIRLYVSCGFRLVGEIPKARKRQSGEYIDRFIMLKSLFP